MGQEEHDAVLGIQLVDDQLRIVEGRRVSQDEFQIVQVAQGRTRQPFDFDVFDDRSLPRRFAEDIMRLYQSQKFQAKGVAFSLDSRMVLVKRLKLEESLQGDAVEDHVNWEVGQFTVAPVDDYVVDFEEIERGTDAAGNLLIVVVRKKIVRFLKAVFQHTDLHLSFVDVDMFSAQRSLLLNYDYKDEDKVCIVDVEDKKIHFSFMRGGAFFFTQEVESGLGNNNLEIGEESRSRLISKELRRIIVDSQIGSGIEDLSEIYLYGERVENGVLEALQNGNDVPINRADPFRKIKVGAEAKDELGESRHERYMISVGAALRAIH